MGWISCLPAIWKDGSWQGKRYDRTRVNGAALGDDVLRSPPVAWSIGFIRPKRKSEPRSGSATFEISNGFSPQPC
jgi:hypothetical protein